MSQAQLAALEREVEQARSRFANDLARLRSPATFSAFKDELVEKKDELIQRAKDSAKDTAQRMFDDLKEKAVANPAAALAIGAGLAWRLARHPPIASLLVGVGLVSLLRTTPAPRTQPYMGLDDEDSGLRSGDGGIAARASEVADTVKERVQDWSAEAGETTRETVAQLKEKATALADRATEAARHSAAQIADTTAVVADRASKAARNTAAQIADKAAAVTDKASTALHDAIPDQETRDKLLLGTAALAVVAAVGIAYQRRNQEERQHELVH